jgi:hypothetical protein
MEIVVSTHVVPKRLEFVFIGLYGNESSKYDDTTLGYLKYQHICILYIVIFLTFTIGMLHGRRTQGKRAEFWWRTSFEIG